MGVTANIGATAGGPSANNFHGVFFRCVNHFHVSCCFCFRQAVRINVYTNHPSGATQPGRFHGHDAHRAATKNYHGFAAF